MANKKYYCEQCKQMLDAGKFYTSKNREKYPNDGKLNICKDCATLFVDNYDPDTFLPLLSELDVPYIKSLWNNTLQKVVDSKVPITGKTVLGKYLSSMALNQWKNATYADTDRINAELEEKQRESMRLAGYSPEEIEEEVAATTNILENPATTLSNPNSPDEIEAQLTKEDVLYLKVKWGDSYSPTEWVKMEQLYNDMMNSYDIQGASTKDSLIMICKASLRANQLIDMMDIEGFQKASKVYEALLKSARLTNAQIKGESDNAVDSFSELFAICETQGFVPRYYTSKPQDKVDETLRDIKNYTHTLVMEESNLEQLIINSFQQIESDRKKENSTDEDEESLFEEDDVAAELNEQDYIDFSTFAASQKAADEEEYDDF